jgi:hypothetical protein
MSADRPNVVHVIGLQRSGTNYVNKLLALNTDAAVIPTGDRSICWKHSLPWERGPGHSRTGLSAGEALRQRTDVRVLLVSKDPLTWWESIATRNAQDLFHTRRQCRQPDGSADITQCCLLYNAYYTSWMKLVDHRQIWHVRYENALADPAAFVAEIARFLSLTVVPPAGLAGDVARFMEFTRAPMWARTVAARWAFRVPAAVPYSKRFTRKQRQYYLTRAVNLPETERTVITQLLDESVLRGMGYDISTPPLSQSTSTRYLQENKVS